MRARRWLVPLLLGSFAVMARPTVGFAQIGPLVDFRQLIDIDVATDQYYDTGVYWVKWTKFHKDRVRITPNPAFFGSNPNMIPNNNAGCGISPATCMVGFGYLDDSAMDGNVQITTLYGLDANPDASADLATMTGFTPVEPEALFSEETYIGHSQDFVADSLGTFAIGDLGTSPLFANLDLTRIVGDPTSTVVAFRATVPIEALSNVPEPSSFLSTTVGVALGLWWRRRATRAA